MLNAKDRLQLDPRTDFDTIIKFLEAVKYDAKHRKGRERLEDDDDDVWGCLLRIKHLEWMLGLGASRVVLVSGMFFQSVSTKQFTKCTKGMSSFVNNHIQDTKLLTGTWTLSSPLRAHAQCPELLLLKLIPPRISSACGAA